MHHEFFYILLLREIQRNGFEEVVVEKERAHEAVDEYDLQTSFLIKERLSKRAGFVVVRHAGV